MGKLKRGSHKGANSGMGSSIGAVPGSGPQRKRGRWDTAGPGKGPLVTDKRGKPDASKQGGQGEEDDKNDHDREYKALMERTKGKQKAAEFHRQEQLRSKLTPSMAPPTFINLPNVPTVNEFVDAMLGDLGAPAAMTTSPQDKAGGRRGKAKGSVARSNNAFAALHMDSGDEDEEEEDLPIMHPATFVPKKGAKGMEKRRAVTEGHAESEDEEEEEEEEEQQGPTEGAEEEGEAGPAGGCFMAPGTFIPPVIFAPATFVPPTAAAQAGTGGVGQDVDDFSDL